MVNSKGLRGGTRSMFSKDFKTKGIEHLSTYLVNYKVGDFIDINVNGAIHKGMPHKYYQGKTGRVFNVTKRAVGVEVNKRVGVRILKKRIHVRVEHIKKSRCREEFLKRVIRNDLASKEFKKTGKKIVLKRSPGAPKAGKFVSLKTKPVTVTPLKYDPMY
eukprot:c32103_g1_i1.p2 GENE.c32103_g1_i1~~c32103_g1_i1.p2  ORF type:complete len:160 (+),score=39.41 c32103_g1_i1:36-515(+)